jgi:hypothetical protein
MSSTSKFIHDIEENKTPWPIASSVFDDDYHLLQPSAPHYAMCGYCRNTAMYKCQVCSSALCVHHSYRLEMEKEWCVTWNEKTYYNTLILCDECKAKESRLRRIRLMSSLGGVILFVLLVMILTIIVNL